MIETSNKEINVDELMKKIKEEIRKKKPRPEPGGRRPPDFFSGNPPSGPLNAQSVPFS